MVLRSGHCVYIAIAISLALLMYFIYDCIHDSIEAEKNLHAYLMACSITEEYIKENKKWPKSWMDLESMNYQKSAFYSWPRDRKEVRRRVTIDFDVTIEDVLAQSDSKVIAVAPHKPIYSTYDREIPFLVDIIRETLKEMSQRQRPATGTGLNGTIFVESERCR